MRSTFGIAVCLLILGTAAADEQPGEKPVPKAAPAARTTDAAAEEVLAAFKAQESEALTALAGLDAPDPWLVTDLLCFQGERDAATAFAKAAQRKDVEKLPDYVTAWAARRPDKDERDVLAAMNEALVAGRYPAVLEGTASLDASLETVVRIRLFHVRGNALGRLNRLAESESMLCKAADAALALGWLSRAATLYNAAGLTAWRASNWSRAKADWSRRLEIEKRRENERGAAQVMGNLGNIHYALGQHDQALAIYEDVIKTLMAHGDEAGAAINLGNVGNIQFMRGELDKALATQQRAYELKRKAADHVGAATTLGNIGNIHFTRGDYPMALSVYERTYAEQIERNEDPAGAAMTLGNIGNVHASMGDYPKALAFQQRAWNEKKRVNDRAGAANILGNIGNTYVSLGDFAKALAVMEKALAQQRALQDAHSAAITLGNMANAYFYLGEYEKALEVYRRALAEKTALNYLVEVGRTLGNMGSVLHAQGKYAEALSTFNEAFDKQRALGDGAGAALTLGNIVNVHLATGAYEKALETGRRALDMKKSIRDLGGVAQTLVDMGRTHIEMGNLDKALEALEEGRRQARSQRSTRVLVLALLELARMHLGAGRHVEALGHAREALDAVEALLGGLGEEQGATARETYSQLFSVGALAAVRKGDAAAALTFLESGRAGALLDALGKREVLRWKAESLPPELREADRRALAAQSVARQAYDRALQHGRLDATKKAAVTLDRATETVREIAGRIQRELKQQAGLYYPRAATIEAIESSLEKGEALVIYGLCLDEALALVLTRDGRRKDRIVRLGSADAVGAACEALHASDKEADPTQPRDALRKLLVEPLKLGKDVTQVLVSPEGPLCYLPFGVLFDQLVAMTPSGTTHVLLRSEERDPGEGVFGVGDPDYAGASKAAQAIYLRGRSLSPLPSSKVEVERVATRRLLGPEANEQAVRTVTAEKKRWRAVHFACHGLIDVDRPMLSSLALSRAGEDDGFLTALEVLRMEMPADLAVLSACETATGKIVRGEGIVGLTRAFMFAGAPRVICSLWKVDDEATKELMVRFYELWNPKGDEKAMGAAEALKKAQAFIRDHENGKWRHPHFWAAWVLWGLPD